MVTTRREQPSRQILHPTHIKHSCQYLWRNTNFAGTPRQSSSVAAGGEHFTSKTLQWTPRGPGKKHPKKQTLPRHSPTGSLKQLKNLRVNFMSLGLLVCMCVSVVCYFTFWRCQIQPGSLVGWRYYSAHSPQATATENAARPA